MKLQGTVGSDTRVYHVNTGVVLGQHSLRWGWRERATATNRKIPQACEVRMPSESLLSCTPTQSQFNPVRTSERFLLEILLTSIFL